MTLDLDGVRRPGDLSLADRNRRLLADRLGWPEDSAQQCERIEREHPGVDACWFSENTRPGFERAAGFYAWPSGVQPGTTVYVDHQPRWVRRDEWFGVTVEELGRDISARHIDQTH